MSFDLERLLKEPLNIWVCPPFRSLLQYHDGVLKLAEKNVKNEIRNTYIDICITVELVLMNHERILRFKVLCIRIHCRDWTWVV